MPHTILPDIKDCRLINGQKRTKPASAAGIVGRRWKCCFWLDGWLSRRRAVMRCLPAACCCLLLLPAARSCCCQKLANFFSTVGYCFSCLSIYFLCYAQIIDFLRTVFHRWCPRPSHNPFGSCWQRTFETHGFIVSARFAGFGSSQSRRSTT